MNNINRIILPKSVVLRLIYKFSLKIDAIANLKNMRTIQPQFLKAMASLNTFLEKDHIFLRKIIE